MAHILNLSATQIRYLLTMLKLSRDGCGVRCADLAVALNVTKPSAHNMISVLTKTGLVRKDFYGGAYFTHEGKDVANRYSRYFDAIHNMLIKAFPGTESLEGAGYAILAEIPEENLLRHLSLYHNDEMQWA